MKIERPHPNVITEHWLKKADEAANEADRREYMRQARAYLDPLKLVQDNNASVIALLGQKYEQDKAKQAAAALRVETDHALDVAREGEDNFYSDAEIANKIADLKDELRELGDYSDPYGPTTALQRREKLASVEPTDYRPLFKRVYRLAFATISSACDNDTYAREDNLSNWQGAARQIAQDIVNLAMRGKLI